jgi:type II pantothenate kinase
MSARPVAAIDFGSSNTDVVWQESAARRHWVLPSEGHPDAQRLTAVLAAGGVSPADVAWIAVTGGNRSTLPQALGDTPIYRVDEVQAIGRGGLALAGRTSGVVTSAGSGTAVVAAGPAGARHITGTGVGGGTLVGLARLLVGTVDPLEIDALAAAGTETSHNLTIAEVLGHAIGALPPETTAVNFGRVARHPVDAPREDMAAALVNLVGQVIAVIAINAARAEQVDEAIIVGHLAELPSIRRTLSRVAKFYGVTLCLPAEGGSASALGALLETQERLAGR